MLLRSVEPKGKQNSRLPLPARMTYKMSRLGAWKPNSEKLKNKIVWSISQTPVSVASFLFIWLRVALYAACVWRRNDVLDTDTDDVISVSTFSILKLQLPISWGGFLFFWGGEGHAKTVAILTDHTSLICFSFLLMWHQWTECRNIPQACHMILPQGRYSFCFCDQQLSVCHI